MADGRDSAGEPGEPGDRRAPRPADAPMHRPDPDRTVAKLVIPGPAGRERRFVAAVLVLVVLGLAGVVAAGAIINPRGEFPTRLYQPITLQAVATKADLFEAHAAPAVLILGSSRSMAMTGEPWANGTSWFNFGIPGASMKDLDLLWTYAVDAGGAPGHVVILLDSFALRNPSDGYPVEILASPASWRFTSEGRDPGELAREALQTMSVPYLRDELTVLKYTYVSGYPPPRTTYDADGMRLTNPDGSRTDEPTPDLEAAVEAHWNRVVRYVYVEPLQPRQAQMDLFTQTVERMRADGATVDIVLTPFNDHLFDRLAGNPVFEEFQAAALELALAQCQAGVRVFDYTRVEAFGGDPDGFLDGYHLTRGNALHLAEAVVAGQGQASPAPA
jgi:hypothetical protein